MVSQRSQGARYHHGPHRLGHPKCEAFRKTAEVERRRQPLPPSHPSRREALAVQLSLPWQTEDLVFGRLTKSRAAIISPEAFGGLLRAIDGYDGQGSRSTQCGGHLGTFHADPTPTATMSAFGPKRTFQHL